MRMPPYLLVRPSGYYFRFTIPHDLRDRFGKSEIRKSLSTHDRRQALLMAAALSANVHENIRSLRLGMVDIFDIDPKKIRNYEVGSISVGPNGVQLNNVRVDSSNPADVAAFNQTLENIGRLSPPILASAPKQTAAHLPDATVNKAQNFLFDMLEKFILEKSIAGYKQGTIDDYQESVGLLLDVIGNKPISHYTHEDANRFIELLQQLPTNRNKKKEYSGQSLWQIATTRKELGVPAMSGGTIDKHTSNCSSFFNWALRKKYFFGDNIFEGKKIRTKAQREEANEKNRTPFDHKELSRIFDAVNYATRRTPHDFWFPLIALFSGMRLNEISQLYLDDIVLQEGIWVFDINKNSPDKKLKTRTSKRLLPVHPKLIELGFIEFANEMRGLGHERLFWWLKKAVDGYGRRPGRNFANYLDTLGVTGSDKVFHSFRHTFNNTLKEHQLDEEARCELMGHSHDNVNSAVYSSKHRLSNKLEFLSRLKYDGIDFAGLSYKQGDFADFFKSPDQDDDEKSAKRKASLDAHAAAVEERKKRSLAAGKASKGTALRK